MQSTQQHTRHYKLHTCQQCGKRILLNIDVVFAKMVHRVLDILYICMRFLLLLSLFYV